MNTHTDIEFATIVTRITQQHYIILENPGPRESWQPQGTQGTRIWWMFPTTQENTR